jgi:hypothetical protein
MVMELTTTTAILVPTVVGITQVIKVIGVPSRFLPLIALGVGSLGAIVLGGLTGEIAIQGIIVGLMAVGLWSGTSNTLGVDKK